MLGRAIPDMNINIYYLARIRYVWNGVFTPTAIPNLRHHNRMGYQFIMTPYMYHLYTV